MEGAKAQMALLAAEGPKEAESGQDQPGSRAFVEVRGAEELSGEGPSAGFRVAWNCEDHGACGSGQENEKQAMEPVPEGMWGTELVQSVPLPWSCPYPVRVLVPKCIPHHRFTVPQLQKLESVFQRSHYISSTEANHLARCMGVTEARVQKWFWKRREQYRSYKRL